jgi:hypothetical protein
MTPTRHDHLVFPDARPLINDEKVGRNPGSPGEKHLTPRCWCSTPLDAGGQHMLHTAGLTLPGHDGG